MARPARFNADYFTHSADLRNDRRVKAIRTAYGAAGYGLFIMLLEALTDADNTALPIDEMELELLAGDFGVSATDIRNLSQFAIKVGYFTTNDAGLLTCPELNSWLAPVFDKRNRARNAAPAALLPQPVSETGVSVTVIPQSKVKESRVEDNIKEKLASSAGQDSASLIKNPIPLTRPTPRPPKLFRYDNAPAFLISEFFTFLMTQGYGHVDRAMYLQRIQEGARKGVQDTRKLKEEATNDEWKAFILRWLDGDKANKRLLMPDEPPRAGSYSGPNPVLQVTTSSTSYSPAAIAARNITKY